MADTIIRSRQNPTLKFIRSLLRRDRRRQERAFVVEGPTLLREAVTSGHRPLLVAVKESFDLDEFGRFISPSIVRVIDDGLFDEIADTVTPPGVVAVFSIPEIPRTTGRPLLTLIADQVRDPGNLGTLLRSCAAVSCSALLCTPGTVDPYGPKVVRAGAGAHFVVPISELRPEDIQELRAEHETIVLADHKSERSYESIDLTVDAAIVVGSETSGPSHDLRSVATVSASIPISARIESLNAAVAGSIFLFEANRQRRILGKMLGNV